MSADLNLRVDMGAIQSSVQARIRPAVEAALAKVDVQALIEAELARKPEKEEGSSLFAMMYGRTRQSRPLIEELVAQAIHDLAKEFVEKAVRSQREKIEDALQAMMMTSTRKIVRAFAKAIERGLESEWNFELDVKVTASEEADDD